MTYEICIGKWTPKILRVFMGAQPNAKSWVEKRYMQPSLPISCLELSNESIRRTPKIKRIFTPHPDCILGTFLERLPHLAGGEVARTGEAVEEHALDVDVAVVQRAPELQQDIFAGAREVNRLVS